MFEPEILAYYAFQESGGIVEEVLVQPGDEVQAGDALVQLELGDSDIALKERELALARSREAIRSAAQRGESTALLELELDIAGMRVERARQALAEKRLVSGMDGVVAFVADIAPGSEVERWEPLVTVADPSQMRLFYTGSSGLYQVELGMEVEIDYEGSAYSGRVVQTPSSAPPTDDEAQRSRNQERIYIAMEEVPEGASFGDYARIRIVLSAAQDTLWIPAAALRTYMGREYVQVLEGESRREVDVETGLKTPASVEIVDGLTEGQRVILR